MVQNIEDTILQVEHTDKDFFAIPQMGTSQYYNCIRVYGHALGGGELFILSLSLSSSV